MTNAQFLLSKLKNDDGFRNQVLSAHTMAERTEFIAAKGFSCSSDEIRTILYEFMDKNRDERKVKFTLWGNKITQENQ